MGKSQKRESTVHKIFSNIVCLKMKNNGHTSDPTPNPYTTTINKHERHTHNWRYVVVSLQLQAVIL